MGREDSAMGHHSCCSLKYLPGKGSPREEKETERRQPHTLSRFCENAFGSMRYEGFWHLGYPSAFFASQFSQVFFCTFFILPHDSPIIPYLPVIFLALLQSTTWNNLTWQSPNHHGWNPDIPQRVAYEAQCPQSDDDSWTTCWGKSLTYKMSKRKHKPVELFMSKQVTAYVPSQAH